VQPYVFFCSADDCTGIGADVDSVNMLLPVAAQAGLGSTIMAQSVYPELQNVCVLNASVSPDPILESFVTSINIRLECET
jgi:hypothetical protein